MSKQKPLDHERLFNQRIKPFVRISPWVLRITEFKDLPAPVLVVKQRVLPDTGTQKETGYTQPVLKDRGLIHGQSLRRCLPVLREIIGGVCDPAGIPLELHTFVPNGRIGFRGNLPLDEEAGAKLSLIFRLQERILDMDRVELIARRVQRFSREEAVYWLTRATQYGDAANRWAQAGLRLMLGGQPGDSAIPAMLEKIREE